MGNSAKCSPRAPTPENQLLNPEHQMQAAGGTVTCLMGCYRVMGMLAMSRALGDVIIEHYLSQVPARQK